MAEHPNLSLSNMAYWSPFQISEVISKKWIAELVLNYGKHGEWDDSFIGEEENRRAARCEKIVQVLRELQLPLPNWPEIVSIELGLEHQWTKMAKDIQNYRVSLVKRLGELLKEAILQNNVLFNRKTGTMTMMIISSCVPISNNNVAGSMSVPSNLVVSLKFGSLVEVNVSLSVEKHMIQLLQLDSCAKARLKILEMLAITMSMEIVQGKNHPSVSPLVSSIDVSLVGYDEDLQ